MYTFPGTYIHFPRHVCTRFQARIYLFPSTYVLVPRHVFSCSHARMHAFPGTCTCPQARMYIFPGTYVHIPRHVCTYSQARNILTPRHVYIFPGTYVHIPRHVCTYSQACIYMRNLLVTWSSVTMIGYASYQSEAGMYNTVIWSSGLRGIQLLTQHEAANYRRGEAVVK